MSKDKEKKKAVSETSKIICPKCGKEGWLIIQTKTYMPKRHFSKPRVYETAIVSHKEQKGRKVCYLGSLNPTYGKKIDISKLKKAEG